MRTDIDAPVSADPGRGGVKWIVILLLGYWATYALVAPVSNYDSQTYNLARLYIAHAGGLFGNHEWTTVRQIVFPWTFDAVHYPFLFLHCGYDLPSFACFLGLLLLVHRLVSGAGTTQQAWWCCLAFLALPTLVFQAVSTKNDLAVVFALGCWYYAWKLWRAEGRDVYLLLMALALSFAAGAKTSGLPYFGLLGAFSLWHLRANRPAAFRFAGWMTLCFVLFGSVEIYLNNWFLYHAPLGPSAFIEQNKNRDGLAGGLANLTRYCIGNMNVGLDAANPKSPVSGYLESWSREFLSFTGLSGDVGFRSYFGDTDANIRFLKDGGDASSDYGPVGAAALVAGFVFLLTRRWSDYLWKLSAAGLATLTVTSFTVAWMIWNARFLMLSFCLLTLALVLWTFESAPTTAKRFWRTILGSAMIYSAFVYPLHSFAKRPADIWQALVHRPAYETRERPGMLDIIKDLRARAPALGSSTVLLHAGGDSWIVCFMELRGLHFVPAPLLSRQTLLAASHGPGASSPARPVYVLTVDLPIEAPLVTELTLVRKYPDAECALYRWDPPPSSSAPVGSRSLPLGPETARVGFLPAARMIDAFRAGGGLPPCGT